MNLSLYKWHVYSALFVSIFFTFLLLTGIANVFHSNIKQWENPYFFQEIETDLELLTPEGLYREFSSKHTECSISLLRKISGKERKPIECMLKMTKRKTTKPGV